VHLPALRHPPRVVRPYDLPQALRTAPRGVHQVGKRGLGGGRDRVGGSPGEHPREDGERLRHREVHVERREELRRGAPERGHGRSKFQHRARACRYQLPQRHDLRIRELLVTEAEHALHGAQRVRPHPDPSPNFPPGEALAPCRRVHVRHPADVKPGEPARQGVRAGMGAGRGGERREEEEHALLVLVDVVDDARGRLRDRPETAAVEFASGGGRGTRAGGMSPELDQILAELVG
jgi:hypothetical protein